MKEQARPERAGDMRHLLPASAIIGGTIDGGEMLLILVVAWTAGAEVIVCHDDLATVRRVRGQAENRGTAEIRTRCGILKGYLREVHAEGGLSFA